MATFRIKKNKKKFSVIQTTKNVCTNNKPRKSNLGNFKTLREAKKVQKLARRLVGNLK